MSKAVLISIRPKWCDLIASGKKTIEIRKTAPKLSTPFKCYIYQTLPKSGDWNERDGRVIGEFICNRIELLDYDSIGLFVWDDDGKIGKYLYKIGENACLTRTEVIQYTGAIRPYGWFINDLVIYDKPKELGEYRSWNTGVVFKDGYPMPTHEIKRPPQSWMYVEELR